MKGKLSQNNEATTSFCSLLIIGNVPLMNQTMDDKVSGMGRKTDSIGNFYFPESNGRKEELKNMPHGYIITLINSKSEYRNPCLRGPAR
jgi:hypothetical protein